MQYLDLDAVANQADFVLKLNGREHTLHVATVDTFIANMKDLEGLALNASAARELEVAMNIIKRAFPTIPEDELRKLKVTQIKVISDYAQGANGENVTKTNGSAEGNAPAANG